MYVAIKRFVDLTDGDHIYNAGDVYPRDGFEPSRERIIELATSKNKLETPLITYIEDKEKVVVEANVVGQAIVENSKTEVEDEKSAPKKTTKKAKSE
nr:MAG TPA: hypothetical protein [Caudoviricetes sp.]